MEYFNAIILGIIEGLTEFLPISSTGHLIVATRFFPLYHKDFMDSFVVMIQSGAMLAVLLYFWKRFWPWPGKNNPHSQKQILSLWLRTIVASMPAMALAFVLRKPIKEFLFNSFTVAMALIFWGIAIVVLEWWLKKRSLTAPQAPAADQSPEKFGWKKVIGIGLFQCLALIPGTSRSAATIVGAMLLGSTRVASAEFSFFLALPVLLAAGVYELLGSKLQFNSEQWVTIAIGTVVSFIVALLVIRVFMNIIKRISFSGFGWYRIIAGLGVLLLLLFGSI